jgi:dephospho-CoA kinase
VNALRIGLTGGLASGKSTVARLLAARGATVVDADRLVAELYEPGQPGARAAAELFGPAVLDRRGAVDRARLAGVVFPDPEARRRLERAIHPLVRERFAELARDAEGVVVLEATLLVEAGYGPDFDQVVTVEADPEVRIARAVARGMPEVEARRRLLAQGEGEARRAGADRTIHNHGDLAELERQVDALWAELQAPEDPRNP